MTTEIKMESEIIGEGDPLVLVPGGLTGWLSWEPFVPELAKDRKVIRVQLLNVEYGLENKPLPKDYSLKSESQALGNTLSQLGVDEADFVAWSYGAATCLDFALNHPEKIRTLTLIEPPAIWVLRSQGPLSEEMLEQEKLMQNFNTNDVTEDQLEWFTHFAGFVPPNTDPKTLPQWPVWAKHRQSLKNSPAVFEHNDSIERVRNFNQPVLLITGEGTAPFLAQITEVLAQEFPNARVERYPGGHAPHIVAKNRFLSRLSQFLDVKS